MNVSPRAAARVPSGKLPPGAYLPLRTPCASGAQTLWAIPCAAETAVRHLAVHLGREHERVPRAAREHLTEELLRASAGVDVRGVDEVDAGVEGGRDTGVGLVALHRTAVGQPGAETDLGDVELA